MHGTRKPEDHGGFDRISPQGPFETSTEAQRDAVRIFKVSHITFGKPDHYA